MTATIDDDKIKLRRKWIRIFCAILLLTLLTSCAILTKFFPDIVFGITGMIVFTGAVFLVAKFGKKRTRNDLERGEVSNLDEFGFQYTAELVEIPPNYNTATEEPPYYDSNYHQPKNLNNGENLPSSPPIVNSNQNGNSYTTTRLSEAPSSNNNNIS